MKACAVVPTYRHWRVLGHVVEQLRAAGLAVFVVDDGSPEPAASAIAALHDPARDIRVHRLAMNAGKGAAVIAGFEQAWSAGYTHAVQVDADGQHDLDALAGFLQLAAEYPDAVIAGQACYDRSVPVGRRFGRWLTHFWVWVETLSLDIRDSMCGFRVYPLAPVRALLAQRRVMQRMDFDIDIVVRLFWNGIRIVNHPVNVAYPPENTSNFDLWRDNLRITRLHAGLCLGMLLRLPRLLAGRRGQAAGQDRHWSDLAERGARWGLRFCAWAYRLLGRRGCLAVMMPIVAWFFLAGREQREASRVFLGRVFGRPASLFECYRHFLAFAARSLDTFIAWTGGLPPDAVTVDDPGRLAAAIKDPRGAVVVVAHLGNVEVARALLDPATRNRLTVLVHTRHAANFNRILRDFAPQAALNLVQVTDIGPDTAMALKERVEKGEWIVIAGDRTPVGSTGRTSRVPFLGLPASFSHGPWILGAVLGCPVHMLFCLRQGQGWRLSLEPFADAIVLPRRDREAALEACAARYAACLEREVRQAPFQWNNFFMFWA